MQSKLSRRYFLSSLGALSAAALLPRAAQAVFADGDRCTNSGSMRSLNRGYWIDSLGGPGGYTDDTSTPLSQTALADAVKSGLSAVNLTVSGGITGTQSTSIDGAPVTAYVITTNISTSGNLTSTGVEHDWFDPAVQVDLHQDSSQSGSYGIFKFTSQVTRTLISAHPS